MVFMFKLPLIFRILRSWKARFSHCSISPHELCTKEFQVLGYQKSVRNWNKVNKIHILGVETSIIPIGNTNIHIQNNVRLHKKVIFISVLWIYSCNELKWWQIYYISTIVISNSQIQIIVSYSRSTNVNVKMSFS